MIGSWFKYKLSEIGTIVGGATPSTNVEAYYNGNIPWLTPKDLSDFQYRYIEKGKRNITKSGLNSCSAQFLPAGSVLFSSRAPIGYIAIAKNPIVTNQGFKSIIPDKEKVDSLFLYYLLKYKKNDIEALGSGTTFKEVSGFTMKNVEVFIPSLKVQQQIAGVLGALDDKIELNRRINENLEQQAQALFKSWFVDFEPFKDGKFVDSELGMIPEGWRVGTLEEIGQIIGGGTPSKANSSFYCENGIPWITPKDLSINKSKYISRGENDITEIGYRNSSAKKIPAGSVLFSSRAPIGYIAIANNEVTTNQGFKSVIPTKAGTCFIYLFLQLYKKYIESLATGSTFKEASGALMKSLKLKIPPQSIFENFESMLNPLFSQQCVLESEIDHLSKLRDTLLPRLMSGELQI